MGEYARDELAHEASLREECVRRAVWRPIGGKWVPVFVIFAGVDDAGAGNAWFLQGWHGCKVAGLQGDGREILLAWVGTAIGASISRIAW